MSTLTPRFHVYNPERRCKTTPDIDGPYTFETAADDAAACIDVLIGGPARLVGISDEQAARVARMVRLHTDDTSLRIETVEALGQIPVEALGR